MAKAIGPTVPRWQLGDRLNKLREQAGLSLADVADELDCSEWKIRRIESGQVGLSRPELRTLLDLYDVEDRGPLEELQQLGKQRGWWSRYGKHLSQTHVTLLGIETAATTVRAWEPLVVPGLLQTEAYARAVARSIQPDESAERAVEIRLSRQKLVWDDDPPTAWYVLDESVLYRRIGGEAVMREQLTQLLDPPPSCTIQVLPLNCDEHPGTPGGLTIFEFDPELHTPIVYVESHAGSLYLEEAELDRCKAVIDHAMAVALSPAESRRMIRRVLGKKSPDYQEDTEGE